MSRTIETSIEINAPSACVWDVLTRFEEFPEWSRFILSVNGVVSPGKTVTIRLNDGGSDVIVKPKIIVLDEKRELGWRGVFGSSLIFMGEHRFVLEETGAATTRLQQSELFTGVLLPLLWRKLNTRTRLAFEAFNNALRARAELVSS